MIPPSLKVERRWMALAREAMIRADYAPGVANTALEYLEYDLALIDDDLVRWAEKIADTLTRKVES